MAEPTSDTPVAEPTTKVAAKTRRARPDPRPARLMIGAGAVAALTVIGAGLVRFPVAAEDSPATPLDGAAGSGQDSVRAAEQAKTKVAEAGKTKVMRPVRYVRLKPGQNAPRGARVIREAAPAPRVVVRRVAAAPAPRASRRAVTRTRQSG